MKSVKITTEQIAKVFSLYLGNRVLAAEGTYLPLTIERLSAIFNASTNLHEKGIGHYKLILTPLLELTEKDALDVARIIGVSYGNDPESDAHFDISGLSYYLHELFEKNSDIRDVPGDKLLNLVDYLHSRGYMLPHMGIDLYESGIAIKSGALNTIS